MKPGRIVMIVAGAVMLTFGLFLDWAKNSEFEDLTGIERTGNHPFKYAFGGAAWVIIVLVGVLALLLALDVLKSDQAPWSRILLGGAGLGTVLMVIQLLAGGGDETFEGTTWDLDPYLGMYVALAAAVLSLIGAVIDVTGERRVAPATA